MLNPTAKILLAKPICIHMDLGSCNTNPVAGIKTNSSQNKTRKCVHNIHNRPFSSNLSHQKAPLIFKARPT